MLTKWGAALGLASAGRVTSGGGGNTGVPLGPFADWAALPASAQDGALASVTSLGPGNAYGIAVYDGGASEWALYMAWFDTVADMIAFSDPISTGALASVEQSASDDENAVRYQWDGSAWARTAALTSGYAWTLTSITDLDPSGVGATRTGDYGDLNGSLYRLTAPLALPNGGTRAVWVPADLYAKTWSVVGYADGTESLATVALQGLTVVTTGTGTVTALGTEYQLLPNGGSSTAGLQVVTTNRRYLMRAKLRASRPSSGTHTAQMLLSQNSLAAVFARTQLTSSVVRGVDSTGASAGTVITSANYPTTSDPAQAYEVFASDPGAELYFQQSANGAISSYQPAFFLAGSIARVLAASGALAPSPALDLRASEIMILQWV